MTRRRSKLLLGTALVILVSQSDVFAGRGGGYGGGGGASRGGGSGYGGGSGRSGGGMGGTPSFSQPRQSTNQSGAHSQYGGGSGSANSSHPAGGAAAGAGYANNNRNQGHPAGAAAAGAGYANNQNQGHPAGAAAASAGYANNNRNQGHPAGAAAAGAGYANNQNQGLAHPGAAGAAAGAGYANNHSGGYGAWNGNNYAAWGATGYGGGYGGGGVAAWGAGSPMYGWGYSGYSNPYSAGYGGGGGGAQHVAAQQPDGGNQQAGAQAYNYSQPINTTSAPPEQAVAGQADASLGQARDAFKAGDYGKALQLDEQALSQTPDDRTLHEFLALVYFAQGKYDQAAEPLYAVLSVAPGWDWTTLSGMYPDVDTYTGQLRALEASIKANPNSAHARFVLAYQYLCQGHIENAVVQLKETVKLQPDDTLSAQLIAYYQPAGTQQPPAEPVTNGAPAFEGKLAGSWMATPVKNAKVALVIKDDGKFNWDASSAGKPPTAIAGSSTFADGVLTLTAEGSPNGALAGKVAWQDADHFTFRLVSAPAGDPGLKFAR